ncbi:hypothetical protein JOC61_002223 [Marinitoga litoralis]|jgi:hypothetical protein|nr:hypothetical protein [Marinitoga litoralis]
MNILKRIISGKMPLGGCTNRSQRCADLTQ